MRKLTLAILAATAAALPQAANASLVYTTGIDLGGQGFGSHPRVITLQETGQPSDNEESGCISVGAGGTLGTGCVTNAQVHDSNGIQNYNTNGDLVQPLSDNQKFGVPTLSELNWASAADVLLQFNADEGQSAANASINVVDVTLKFYNSATGAFIAALDGSYNFLGTEAGVGSSGWAWTVSADERAWLDGAVFVPNAGNLGGIRIALETTVRDAQGGPDSWNAVARVTSTPPVPEPATWAMMLLGFGAAGYSLRRRKKVALQAA